MIKKLHTKVDKSWNSLNKQDSDLSRVLKQYRGSDRCCLDIILVIVVACLLGLDVQVFQNKGYI